MGSSQGMSSRTQCLNLPQGRGRSSRQQRQIGMFFGYILELTSSSMVWGGHLEYERLYASPDIDFFITSRNLP